MLISKNVATPILKGSQKSSHPFTNVNFKKAASSILKGSQKNSCPFTNANFPLKKWLHLYQ